MNQDIIRGLCRLCAAQDVDTNLLENNPTKDVGKRKGIVSLVGKYLKIKINDKKPLPQRFCSECIEKLHSFDSFWKRCHSVQDLFAVIADGAPLSENQKSLLGDCGFLEKLNFSSNKSQQQDAQIVVKNDDSFNDDADFDYHDDIDFHEEDDDNKYNVEDAEETTPLATRLKRKTDDSADTKRKRGRPRKSSLKVPPLRIKAVNPKKCVTPADTANGEGSSSNTQYEIRESSTNEQTVKDEGAKSECRTNDMDEDDEDADFDNPTFSDDDYVGDKDSQKISKKNPFALFEFKCNTCQEVFKNFSILKRHCKKEHGTSAFVNCVCGKQLRARTAIIEHRRKHTGTSLYKCDTCSKTFNRRSLMCLHMISHMPKDEQPYVCCKCAKRFHTSSLLKKHEKVHLPEEERFLDVCNICQKKFTSKSAVNAHLRAVHYGEKPFVCEHCGNSFSSKAILTDHLTTHSSYAPWPCSVCGRNFKSKYRLNVHMDMHRSVKYRCPHCPMELSTRRTLRMHLLVHKEEKAYVCKVCSKAFRRSKDLKNHSNLHTGRRPYKCEFCERTFANGSNCRAHKLRMHPEELGVEKNSRSSSKQAKANIVAGSAITNTSVSNVSITDHSNHIVNNSIPQLTAVNDPNKLKTLTMLTDVVKSNHTMEYMKYDTKYEFPTSSVDLDYTLDYGRYPTPLNLNMKKPTFMQQPNINHLAAFTTDMHTDVSKVHHFLSYT